MKALPHDLLTELAYETARALGSHEDEAREVARHLVGANLAGHDSHGVGMLPDYVEIAAQGLLVPNVELEAVVDLPALTVLDAKRGFGQWMGHCAMIRGIKQAKANGSCVIGLRNASHIGRIGTYAEQCASAGMISIHFVNVASHEPAVAPFGGREPRFITNPIAIGLPGGHGPACVLDMATSVIALGKARVARNKGIAVPDGSIIDEQGHPTVDPTALVDEKKGALLAFGLHKGSGLAVMCEMLGGAFTGGKTIHPGHVRDGGIINSMLSVVIDADAVTGQTAFVDEIEAIKTYVKSSAPVPGGISVMTPGEPENRARAERLANGIPLDPKSLKDILSAASAAGVKEGLIERVRQEAETD